MMTAERQEAIKQYKESVLYVAGKIQDHLEAAVGLIEMYPKYFELCTFDEDVYSARDRCAELIQQLGEEV